MDFGLQNKVALITGGASGIGAAVVRMFAREGARVAFVDQNQKAGAEVCHQLSRADHKVRYIEGDLAQEATCQRAVAETLTAFGGIDILVNNAGTNDGVGLEQSPAEFMQSLQKNIFHVFAITHFALGALKQSRGAIVNVSSKVAITGQGHTSGYAAAKGGVNALTREWAAALATHGVRVNAVVPAECDTSQYQNWFEAQPNPGDARAMIEKLVPLGGRLTTADEIAATIVFLASPVSSHTTGQMLFVDGGYAHLDRALTQSAHQWDRPPAPR